MRDNIEVEGQIKWRGKRSVSDWTANFLVKTQDDVAEFPNVGSFSRNIFHQSLIKQIYDAARTDR